MTRNLKLPLIVLGVFTLVGVGLGLSGWMIIDAAGNTLISEDGGDLANSFGQLFILVLLMAGIMMTFFTGPTVGAITGLHVGSNSPDRGFAIGAAAVGSFIGFLIQYVLQTVPDGIRVSYEEE